MVDLLSVSAQQAEKLIQTFRTSYQIQLVPNLRNKGAIGNDHRFSPFYSTEQQGQFLDLGRQRVEGGANEKISLL